MQKIFNNTGKHIKKDSSNNGTNKIVPLEIETLETISEIENQNVLPTFSRNEHSHVRQIFNATDNETDSIHYITWLFGILLTCTALLSTLIVPWHNTLKEPFYWYEYFVYFVPSWLALLVAVFIMRLEYWAGIMYDKKMNLFFFLVGIGGVFYAIIALFNSYLYVYYFGLFAPVPYGGMIPASIFGWVFLILILFFRYHHTQIYKMKYNIMQFKMHVK